MAKSKSLPVLGSPFLAVDATGWVVVRERWNG